MSNMLNKPKQIPPRILVVDDDFDVLEDITKFLDDYEVIPASNGPEALSVISRYKHELDAVILDMKMPNMDGREVIRLARDMHPYLPIIIHTGYQGEYPESDIRGFMPHAYVTKPDIEGLVKATASAVQETRNIVKSIGEKIKNACDKHLICPYTVLFDMVNEKAMTAEMLPEKWSETKELVDDNIMPFCRISPLLIHIYEDKHVRICPALQVFGDTYNILGMSIESKLCNLYKSHPITISEQVKTE